MRDRITILEAPAREGDLQDVWRRHDTVFVIDVVDTSRRPGSIHDIDPDGEVPRRGHGGRSSDLHLIDVLATASERTCRLIVFGIEGRRFTPQAGVSPEVAMAAHEVSERIIDTVRRGGAVQVRTTGA